MDSMLLGALFMLATMTISLVLQHVSTRKK